MSADKETRPDRRSIGPDSITAFTINRWNSSDAFFTTLPSLN